MSSLTSRQDTGPAAGAGDAPDLAHRPGAAAVQGMGTLAGVAEHADRHADRVIQRVHNGLAGLAGPTVGSDDVVLPSWNRCLQQYQLHPDQPRQPALLHYLALKERLARHADIIESARYEMTTLYQQLADAESAVVLTDTEAVIVHLVSSPEPATEMAPLGLRVGGVWGENVAGTNGMGTCLAAGGPVSIRREDHFFSQFTPLTCSAVLVYNPAGEVAGALDVTSRSSRLQQHLLVLLGMTARMVETVSSTACSATPTRCTSTADPSLSTPCTKASPQWVATGASWRPTAAHCSSWGCNRRPRSASGTSKTSSSPRWRTCCSAACLPATTRW